MLHLEGNLSVRVFFKEKRIENTLFLLKILLDAPRVNLNKV